MNLLIQLIKAFRDYFFTSPQLIVQSPGRINLIGEHTDYNGGYVFPAAINKYIYAAARKRQDNTVNLLSLDFDQFFSVQIDQIKPLEKGSWQNYVLGVVDQLIKRGFDLGGFDLAIAGNIPIGAGLSSSAALENAVSFALNEVFGLGLSRLDLAFISQAAEHNFAGVRCGIMDQFTSLFGQKDKFIFLNTQNLEYKLVQLKLDEYQIVLINTNVKHSLAGSVYNQLRQLCELAAQKLGVKYLVEATKEQIQTLKDSFSDTQLLALEYVLEENLRVKQMFEAVKKADFSAVGNLLYQSHQGLSKKYKVSCAELDFLVEKAKNSPFVLGARMMGGGFGGCTINIVRRGYAKNFFAVIEKEYSAKFSRIPSLIEVEIVEGTRKVI